MFIATGLTLGISFLYVDDIILTASSDSLRQSIMSKLNLEFAMKDLGPLSYFLGIAVSRNSADLFLSQHKYAVEILDKAGMSQCKPAPTPVTTSGKLCADASSPYNNPTLIVAWLGLYGILPLPVRLFLCCSTSLSIHA